MNGVLNLPHSNVGSVNFSECDTKCSYSNVDVLCITRFNTKYMYNTVGKLSAQVLVTTVVGGGVSIRWTGLLDSSNCSQTHSETIITLVCVN